MQKSLADFYKPIPKSKKRKSPNAEICDNSTDYCSTSKVLNVMSSKDNEHQASEISRLSEEENEAKTDPEEVETKSSEASEDSEGETEIPATTTVTPIEQAIQKGELYQETIDLAIDNSDEIQQQDNGDPLTSEKDTETEKINATYSNSTEVAQSSVNSSNSFSGGCPIDSLFKCEEESPRDFSNKQLHKLLLDLDALAQGIAVPYPKSFVDKWLPGHIRVPCASKCQLRILNPSGNSRPTTRLSKTSHWEVVKEQLSEQMYTVEDVISAIDRYTPGFYDGHGKGMRTFFNQHLHHEVKAKFFSVTLPRLQKLTLELPLLITQPIPWLQQNSNMSLTMSKRQIACLIANLFFNTFPEQDFNGELPRGQNLRTLFTARTKERQNSNFEKLKCILSYFDRVTDPESDEGTSPSQTVSFHRRCLDLDEVRPQWEKIDTKLTKCAVKSKGLIEKQSGMLQVDFANEFVGGGVVGQGCVQEEIRYVTHPELLVSRLFTPRLLDNECLIVQGAGRYCEYVGYADSFKYLADCVDTTPVDCIGRKLNTVVAIDATAFRSNHAKEEQFKLQKILRELNKAYVGFRDPHITDSTQSTKNLTAVATGNWGCGAFGGNVVLKFLIQWMAASHAGRDMLYLTFNDTKLAQNLSKIVDSFLKKPYSVSDVWRLICMYCKSGQSKSLLEFIVS